MLHWTKLVIEKNVCDHKYGFDALLGEWFWFCWLLSLVLGYSAQLLSREFLKIIPSKKMKFKVLEEDDITGGKDIRPLYGWIANLIRTSYSATSCSQVCKDIEPSKTNLDVYYTKNGPSTIYRVVVSCHVSTKEKVRVFKNRLLSFCFWIKTSFDQWKYRKFAVISNFLKKASL